MHSLVPGPVKSWEIISQSVQRLGFHLLPEQRLEIVGKIKLCQGVVIIRGKVCGENGEAAARRSMR